MAGEPVPTPLRATLRLPDQPSQPCLIVLSGAEAGRVYRLDAPRTVLGRDEQVDVRLRVEGVSRRHAEIRVVAGGMVLIDLESTNGVWVEGHRISEHLLRDGERLQLGAEAILQFRLQPGDADEVLREAYELATRDPLTHAFNRRAFDEHLARELTHVRHQRHSSAILPAVSVLVLQVDDSDATDRERGRTRIAGMLRELSTLIAGSIRTEDLLCRVGEEQLAVITRDPGEHGPVQFAQRLRELVVGHAFDLDGTRAAFTVCIGVASWASEYPTPEALYLAAREALFEAQRAGPNRVHAAT